MRKELTTEQSVNLLEVLRVRFEKNMNYHQHLEWSKVEEKLKQYPDKLWSLNEMENTGGEPDVIAYDQKKDAYLFCDCSKETPNGRRSVCYDEKAQQARKEHKPKDNAVDMAMKMGVELLDEDQYRKLQELGDFDLKTSSWLKTPSEIRELGGAIFGDKRYNRVFVYHNGAESYYSVRGFRGWTMI